MGDVTLLYKSREGDFIAQGENGSDNEKETNPRPNPNKRKEECNQEHTVRQFGEDMMRFISNCIPIDRSWSSANCPSHDRTEGYGEDALGLAHGSSTEGKLEGSQSLRR